MKKRYKGARRPRKILLRKELKILAFFITVFIIINYSSFDLQLENLLNLNQEAHVSRVIDGDTIEAENRNESIRLLGINTPERGEFLYGEAKEFLEKELLNKNVTLEFVGDRHDKYGRLLAYVFLGGENINIKMVENGFANYYFYSGRDRYSDELLGAWKQCIGNKVNLCEPSDDFCSSCIKITGSAIINSCSFSCNITGWEIRGEGREKFIFTEKTLAPSEKTYFALDLTSTGGSLFLRDGEEKLVAWERG